MVGGSRLSCLENEACLEWPDGKVALSCGSKPLAYMSDSCRLIWRECLLEPLIHKPQLTTSNDIGKHIRLRKLMILARLSQMQYLQPHKKPSRQHFATAASCISHRGTPSTKQNLLHKTYPESVPRKEVDLAPANFSEGCLWKDAKPGYSVSLLTQYAKVTNAKVLKCFCLLCIFGSDLSSI